MRACTESLQAEYRQFLAPNRKQYLVLKNECDRNAARLPFPFQQKVGVKVYLSALLDVMTGAGLKVGKFLGVRQFDTVVLANPVPFGFFRAEQIYPDRVYIDQVLPGGNRNLAKSAIRQFKGIDLALFTWLWLTLTDQGYL